MAARHTYEDMKHDHIAPHFPGDVSVAVNAAGGAWVQIAPPSYPENNRKSYRLMVGAAAAAWEINFSPTQPDVSEAGMAVPAGVVWESPRLAAPDGTIAGWPWFRSKGGSPETLRTIMFVPVP